MSGGRDPFSREVSDEAHYWFSRMRGPEADAARAEFETWRTADPANAEAYERQLQHWDRSAFLANTPLGQSRRLTSVAKRKGSRGQLAAACVAVVSVGAVAFYVVQAPSTLSAHMLELHVVTSADQRVIALDDDTRVTVYSQSVLDLSFTPKQRHARLSRGSARFELPQADPRPLIVEAGEARVVAGVAAFDVALEGQSARIVASSGSVAAATTAPDAKPQPIAPGTQITLPDSTRGDDRTTSADPTRRDAMLAFSDVTVKTALERFNALGGSRLVLTDPRLGKRKVSGAFRSGDPLGFARAVVTMFGGSIAFGEANTILISGPAASNKEVG